MNSQTKRIIVYVALFLIGLLVIYMAKVKYFTKILLLSKRIGIPWQFVAAIIDKETGSTFNPESYNPHDVSGAWGLFQITRNTANMLGFEGDSKMLFTPSINFDFALLNFEHIIKHRHIENPSDSLFEIACAWNGGSWVNLETNSMARGYANDVLKRMEKF
jgi:soluble lytic murein transglycosylase-like protein